VVAVDSLPGDAIDVGKRLREVGAKAVSEAEVQRGAAAVYSEQGRREQQETLAYYRENARIIREALESAGLRYSGGVNSPYIWIKLPAGLGSWEAFDLLLHQAKVIITPGAGFGACGEGYIRATAFGNAENTRIAASRLAAALR
jgi:LL-diaminopimelate aminotransferase